MSALPSRPATAVGPAQKNFKTRGFLHIVRHGAGLGAMYMVTYHRVDRGAETSPARPAVAEGAQSLLELLERMGVDFRLAEVRGALEDVLRFGSANIPDLWLSDEELAGKSFVES